MVDTLAIAKRLQADGRWVEAEPVKNQMIKEARQLGMDKEEAQAWAYSEVDRLYPPLPPLEGTLFPSALESAAASTSGRVQGLGDIPPSWPELPANASLQAELAWVQSNRLVVVEELSSGATRVHLDRARSPAPSHGCPRLARDQHQVVCQVPGCGRSIAAAGADEQEHVRRERMAIEEIDELLREMREESDRKLLADVPSGIRDRTRSCLDDWVRSFEVDLESDARLHLEAHVADLIYRSAEVIANAADEKEATRMNREPGRGGQ